MGALGIEEDYELGVLIYSLVGNSDLKPITLILLLISELDGCRDRPGPGSSPCGSKTGPVLGGASFFLELKWLQCVEDNFDPIPTDSWKGLWGCLKQAGIPEAQRRD